MDAHSEPCVFQGCVLGISSSPKCVSPCSHGLTALRVSSETVWLCCTFASDFSWSQVTHGPQLPITALFFLPVSELWSERRLSYDDHVSRDGFYLWSCVFAERTLAYAEEDRTYREQIEILKELRGGVLRDAVAVSYCCGLEMNYIFRNHPHRVGRLAGTWNRA